MNLRLAAILAAAPLAHVLHAAPPADAGSTKNRLLYRESTATATSAKR